MRFCQCSDLARPLTWRDETTRAQRSRRRAKRDARVANAGVAPRVSTCVGSTREAAHPLPLELLEVVEHIVEHTFDQRRLQIVPRRRASRAGRAGRAARLGARDVVQSGSLDEFAHGHLKHRGVIGVVEHVAAHVLLFVPVAEVARRLRGRGAGSVHVASVRVASVHV